MKISRKGTLITYQTFTVYAGWRGYYLSIFKNYYGTTKEYTLKQLYTKYIIDIYA